MVVLALMGVVEVFIASSRSTIFRAISASATTVAAGSSSRFAATDVEVANHRSPEL